MGTFRVPPHMVGSPFRETVALLVLEEGERQGWEIAYTARVMAAALSPTRVKARVVGPCVYCGTWLANSVDHVIPMSKGGTDEPGNRAPACLPCNIVKGNRIYEGLGDPSGMYRPKEVADLLNCTVEEVQQLYREKLMPGVLQGRTISSLRIPRWVIPKAIRRA